MRSSDTSGAAQHPLIRGLRIVVDPPHPRALAGLGDQLLGWVEEVDQQPQPIVELVEQLDLLLGLQTQVADVAAYHVVVLLLGEVVVVLAVGARTGELDALLAAVAVQVVVDELAAAVGVQGAQGERQPGANQQQRLEDPLLRLVEHGANLRPLGQAVDEHQGEGMLAAGDAAVVADQIGADLAGPCVLPLGEGADRDLVDQTRGRLGMGATAYAQGTFLGAQQPVDSGSADAAVSFRRVSGSKASSPNFSSTDN